MVHRSIAVFCHISIFVLLSLLCNASQGDLNGSSSDVWSLSGASGSQVPLRWTSIEDEDEMGLLYLQYSLRTELKQRLSKKAEIVLPQDDGFAYINARYSNYKRPTYIAGIKVAEQQDVIEIVNYARSRGIPFVARSGGHSLTTSLRTIQNGIVIDMRGLDQIEFNPITQQVTVGGGVQTGPFANALYTHGMEVTVGSCPCTGVMGVSLGAGIGRLQGKYGYLHDNLLSVRLLLANGTVITASESENAALFWAVRGAGHNFGIALEATFQVYPQQNDGKHYVVDFEYSLDSVEDVFHAMNQVSSPMPKELAIFVIGRSKGATGAPTININLVWAGPKADAQPHVDLFAALSPVAHAETVASWDTLPWETYNGLNNVLCTPEGWARFPIKNFYGANVQSYDIPTMRAFFDGWRDMNAKYAGKALFSVMFESFPQQGVRARSRDSTAFPWRMEADHFLMMEAASKTPEDEDIFDQWLSEQQDAWISTSGFSRLHQYVNYGHGSKDPAEALYGYDAWRLERLRALKEEFDPEGWFNGYQPFTLSEESE